MSNVKIKESGKKKLGKMVIEAALSDEKREDLLCRLKELTLEEDGVEVPEDLHLEVVQNCEKSEYLVLPNREMVLKQLKLIENGEAYPFPPAGYENNSDPDEEKYQYRVGDYVLAQCG